MFFLTLGRKKELVDYVKIGWKIKCGGEYFLHKIIKWQKEKNCWWQSIEMKNDFFMKNYAP